MATDPLENRLLELLAQWEEFHLQGRDVTAEDLCLECPELVAELSSRIHALRSFGPRLDTRTAAEPSQAARAGVGGWSIADYEILGELGQGGMGVVYRAFDRRRGEIVALKTMHRLGPAALHRFKQEFRALADVAHPNLVNLYELIFDGRDWFIAMEFVDGVNFLEYVRQPRLVCRSTPTTTAVSDPLGSTLEHDPPAGLTDDRSRSDRAFSVEPAGLGSDQRACLRRMLRQLAKGVASLHEAGRLHRDLKPSNVLVTGEGRVVILDFGLVAELGPTGLHQSSGSHVLGTAAYMAPEQAASLPVSPASDWYSVGVMLYEALTGRLPFLGRTLEVLTDKQRFDPPSPRELVPDLPDDLNSLCMDLMHRDPETRPSRREVLRRLGDAPSEAENQPSSISPIVSLVGRDRHLGELEDAFAAVKRGQTVVLLLQGRSGIGKSALAQHFLDGLVRRDEAVVLAGRCYEREAVPYKALDSLIDALGRYLKGLTLSEVVALLPRDIWPLLQIFPVLRPIATVSAPRRCIVETPDPQELRRRAFAALRELLARLGDSKPLVLFIDDMQWSDLDSASLLSELLRPPDPPVLLLFGCSRSEDVANTQFLRVFRATQDEVNSFLDRRELLLMALNQTEAESLACTLLGRVGPATNAHAAAIARESGGNPFFIYELSRHFQIGAEWGNSPSPTEGVTLDEVLLSRIRQLSEDSRRLLEVIAVSGRPIGEVEACRAAEVIQNQRATLAILRASRMVRSTGPVERGGIEIYHDRIRETVVAHLAPALLEKHHLRLALALEDSSWNDPEVLAIHFEGAKEHQRAGEYFAKAADQATQMLAFDRAVKLYRLAYGSSLADGTEAHRLRTKLGDALANAGRGAEAALEYLAAIPGANVADALELRRRAALQYLISGRIDEGLAVLRTVLKEVGMTLPTSPRQALWSLLRRRAQIRLRGLGFRQRDPSQISPEELIRIDVCWAAVCGLSITDTIRGADFQARSLLLALRTGEPYRIARALAIEAGHVSCAGSRSRRRTAQLIQTAEALAQRVGHPHALGVVSLAKGGAAHLEGRWRISVDHCDQAEEILRERCTGVAWELNTVHFFSLLSLAYAGRIAELGRRRTILLKEAHERGDRHAVATLSSISLARLAADDPEGVLRELRQVLSEWHYPGFHIQHFHCWLYTIESYLYMGDVSSAWACLSGQWPAYLASLLPRIQRFRVDAHYLRSRLLLGMAANSARPHPLLRAALSDARRLEGERVAWSEALARLIRAGAAAIRGDTPLAITLFSDAAQALDAVDMPLHAAAARRRLGQLNGGKEGIALVASVDAWMKSQCIQNPDRFTAMYVPGLPNQGLPRLDTSLNLTG